MVHASRRVGPTTSGARWRCATRGQNQGSLTDGLDPSIVNRMVNPQTPVTLDATFAALADPTRRAILTRLRSGPATVGELAEPFEVSAPAISKHLALLERRGLIRRRREGRHHRVSLDARPLEEAERWLARYRRFWEARLDALESHLEAAKEEDHDPS